MAGKLTPFERLIIDLRQRDGRTYQAICDELNEVHGVTVTRQELGRWYVRRTKKLERIRASSIVLNSGRADVASARSVSEQRSVAQLFANPNEYHETEELMKLLAEGRSHHLKK